MKNFLEYKLLPLLIRVLVSTLRIEIVGESKLNNRAIFIFWHSQMLAGWSLFRQRKSCALVSQSNDGEILTALLKKWDYKVSRGSSSKGGKDALTDLKDAAKKDYAIVITPDGPRGPAKQIKNGVLIISNESGIPVIPVKINYSIKIVLQKSWDKFQIPLPFSKCAVTFGNEYFYHTYLDEPQLTEFKKRLASEL